MVALTALVDHDVPGRGAVADPLDVLRHGRARHLQRPRRRLREAAQLPDGVDIEREQAAGAQVRGGALEERAPAHELGEVIERVEHADHGVKALAEVEVRHVGLDQLGPWHSRVRAREHLRRTIDAGERRNLRERREDLTAAAAELEQRRCSGGMAA